MVRKGAFAPVARLASGAAARAGEPLIRPPSDEPDEDDWRPRPHDHLVEPVFGGLGVEEEDLEAPRDERDSDLRTFPGVGCGGVLLAATLAFAAGRLPGRHVPDADAQGLSGSSRITRMSDSAPYVRSRTLPVTGTSGE